MQTLHIVTPSHRATSAGCIGLMRLTLQHLGGSHQVIVIGSQEDVSDLRTMGLPVLGYVDGVRDISNTLARRVEDLVKQVTAAHPTRRIIAWGWHAASIASALCIDTSTFAIVDEIDTSCSLHAREMIIIPTSWTVSNYIRSIGVREDAITEPLIGVNPTSLVVDQRTVREILNLEQSELVIGIVGNLGSWQEIVSMVVRLHLAHLRADFVMLPHYRYRAQLMAIAKQFGVEDMLHDTPPGLRSIDVVKVVDGVWAPSIAPYDVSFGVLDIVTIAWEGVPLAVPTSHPVAGVPTVGHHIAWAQNEFDVSGWLLDLASDSKTGAQASTDLTTRIRAIAAPSRFVEGLQMRM